MDWRLHICVSLLLVSISPALAEIKLAVVGPMAGKYSLFGQQIRAGAQMAVDDINRIDGVNGETLVLEVADDRCEPSRAEAIANQLAGKGVVFVAGHFCSGSSIAASGVYRDQNIVQISPFSPNAQFTDKRPDPGGGVYRVFGRLEEQGEVAGAFLASEYPDARIAIVHDSSAYGKGLADKTKIAMETAGKDAEYYAVYDPGETDYNSLVARLNALDIQVLFIGGYHNEAAIIVRQIRDRGMETQIVAGDALLTELYWRSVGSAGEGTLVTFSPDPRKNQQAKDVVERLQQTGVEPEGYTLYAYAAVQAWAEAATIAGQFDYESVVSVLNLGSFQTVLGELTFDDKGNSTLPAYVLYIWHEGKYDYLQPQSAQANP